MIPYGNAWVVADSELDFRDDGTVHVKSEWTHTGQALIRLRTGEAYIVADPNTGLLERVEAE